MSGESPMAGGSDMGDGNAMGCGGREGYTGPIGGRIRKDTSCQDTKLWVG